MRGSRSERQVGSLAGFQVWIADSFMGGPEIVLRGATAYQAKITDTAHGTIRSVEYVIQHLEETLETLTRNLADTRKRLGETQAQAEAPFEYADRLTELVHRQREIEDELDLTKNQASAQLDASSTPEPAVADSEASALKEDVNDYYV